MKGMRAVILFALLAASSCGAPTAIGSPASARADTSTQAASAAPSNPAGVPVPVAGAPSFRQIVGAAKVSEYKVVYKLSSTSGNDTVTGEQVWFFKPPKARFDFSATSQGQTGGVSLFVLADGTYLCFTESAQATCLGMSSAEVGLQQNSAALMQESIVDHPERFDGVLVETRQIAGQVAHCYDVRALAVTAAPFTDGRFCYNTRGIPLLQRFKTPGADYTLEATSLSFSVPDSDFTLPAQPTTLGRP